MGVMDTPSSQAHFTRTQDDRIPLPAGANILPPAYRSAIAFERAHGLSRYYAELEDIYWLFDGWDEVADQLYVDWAAHVSEVDAVRRAFDEFNAGKKVFASREAAEAYYDQLVDRNEGLSLRAQQLRDRFQGPAGLCLLRRRYLAAHPELDRDQRLPDLPSLHRRSLFALAVEAGKTLTSKITIEPSDRRCRHRGSCRKYRSFATRAYLAIDVITFDSSVEKAMQFACGNALVCDSMQIARHVCYDRGQEVKAVTLEGTVIHRSGTITGGTSQQGGRYFEDQEVESLRRCEAELRGKLADVFKNRPKANAEEQLINDETRLKADLQVVRDDLSSTESRLKGVRDELKTLRKKVADSQRTISQIEDELEQLEARAATCRDVIDREEDAIFADFCRRIRVTNIREYEEKQLRGAQEDNAQMLVFNTQVARLNHQISIRSEQVDGTRERLESLQKLADKQRKALEQLDVDRESKQGEIEALELEVQDLSTVLEQLCETLKDKTSELEQVRKEGGKALRVLDKALKEIASCNDEIERLSSERFSIYRRCKLEEIDLPLSKGKLDDIPIKEAAAPAAPMDIDEPEEGTQTVFQADNYGVEVDFDELDEDEQKAGSDMHTAAR